MRKVKKESVFLQKTSVRKNNDNHATNKETKKDKETVKANIKTRMKNVKSEREEI